jgi:hypothetical protein
VHRRSAGDRQPQDRGVVARVRVTTPCANLQAPGLVRGLPFVGPTRAATSRFSPRILHRLSAAPTIALCGHCSYLRVARHMALHIRQLGRGCSRVQVASFWGLYA